MVVHDMASFAAPLAAVVAGVPSVHLGVGPSFPDGARDAGRRMAPLWEEWGQQSDEFAGMFRLAYFDPFPPSLDNPARSLGMRRYSYQPVPLGPLGTQDALGLPRPPWVWVTLATVFNRDRDVWARLVGELAGLDLQVLVTLGGGAEATPLMRSARNLAVRSFVPAAVALAGARAVLCHAGAGTLLGALSQALPVVCWPQGADQFHNARTCEAARAGIAVADAVGAVSALKAVLADERYRSAAQRLRDELTAMLAPAECASVLEDIVHRFVPPGNGE